tara:strand:+ start:14408 stop:16150 length:1743 start_codon:yes stop_codon:yes gene_type:complete
LIDKSLPEGWIKTTLGEAFSWGSGGTPTRTNSIYYDGDIPWLIIRDLNDSYVSDSANQITEEGLSNSSAKWVEPGSILIAMYGSIGKLGIATKRLTTNQAIAFTQPGLVNGKYLFYYLRSIRTVLNNQGKGVAQKNISQTVLNSFPFILAPRVTQDKLVEKIEELFSHIDAGVEGLKQAKTKLQQYRQSVLKDAVTGKLTEKWREQNSDKLKPANELLERILEERRANWEAEQLKIFEEKGKTPKDDKWKEKYVAPKDATEVEDLPNSWVSTITDQVFSFVTSGSRGWAKYYSEEGPLFIRVGNLFHYNVELDFRKLQRVSPPEGSEGSRTKVQEGDNLISITADVGMVGYVPCNFEEAYINQHVALARPVKRVMGKYLSWLLSGDFAKEQFKALQKGATKAGLGLDDIRSISFGLPSLLEQEQIVQEIESKIAGIDRLKKETELKILHASKLKSSILADAFSGKLLENIETDETAEQLLERIKAEKEKLIANKPKAETKRNKKVTSERKSLLAVLSERSEAITPDMLMQEAGFTSVEIDDFYVELALISEKIEQISPEQDTLKNWPYEKTANIKLKLKD